MRAPDLCEAAGISYRQLDFWTRQGLIRPYGWANPGQGHQRDYPPDEARVAIRTAALIKAGLRLRTAHDIARGDVEASRALRQALEATG